jgi:hypothetical protein
MLNVICVKHGTKYNEIHVNRLYSMVKRHLTIPCKFHCFTENPTNLNPDINVITLPYHTNIEGWWWKTYIFSKEHFNNSSVNLYFDLDMVIVNNIDKLVNYKQDKFIGLEDVGRVFGNRGLLGSAVMRWQGHKHSNIWDNFIANPEIAKKYPTGDQAYIWDIQKPNIEFFPTKWIMSYKWEIRSTKELTRVNKKWIFSNVRNPEIDKDTAVLAFHGTPSLEDVQDKIIVENWQ